MAIYKIPVKKKQVPYLSSRMGYCCDVFEVSKLVFLVEFIWLICFLTYTIKVTTYVPRYIRNKNNNKKIKIEGIRNYGKGENH